MNTSLYKLGGRNQRQEIEKKSCQPILLFIYASIKTPENISVLHLSVIDDERERVTPAIKYMLELNLLILFDKMPPGTTLARHLLYLGLGQH